MFMYVEVILFLRIEAWWTFVHVYKGTYMSAHVFNLINVLGKRDKMQGLLSILSLFATG